MASLVAFRHSVLARITTFLTVISAGLVIGLSVIWAAPAYYLALGALGLVVGLVISVLLRQPRIVRWLLVGAWIFRVTMMCALKAYSYASGLNGFYPGDADAIAYHTLASALSSSGAWFVESLSHPPYTLVVTSIYHLLGVDLNLPQILNLVLSSALVLVVYDLGRRVGGDRGGITAALLWAFMPSGVFWSVSLLKDVFVLTGVLLSSYLILALTREAPSKKVWSVGILGTLLITFIRPSYVLAFALALAVSMVVSRGGAKRRTLLTIGVLGVLSVMAVVGLGQRSGLQFLTSATTAEGADLNATYALAGGSGVSFVLLAPPTLRWIIQLPFSVFAPFPWQWGLLGSGFGRLAGAEMLVWYSMYWRVWVRRREILKSAVGRHFVIFAMTCFIAVSFGLPNVGSMYRYRWPALILLTLVLRPRKNSRDGVAE